MVIFVSGGKGASRRSTKRFGLPIGVPGNAGHKFPLRGREKWRIRKENPCQRGFTLFEVVMSIVDGNVLYEKGRITTIDEKESLAFVARAAHEVNRGAAEEVIRRNTPQYRFTAEGKY